MMPMTRQTPTVTNKSGSVGTASKYTHHIPAGSKSGYEHQSASNPRGLHLEETETFPVFTYQESGGDGDLGDMLRDMRDGSIGREPSKNQWEGYVQDLDGVTGNVYPSAGAPAAPQFGAVSYMPAGIWGCQPTAVDHNMHGQAHQVPHEAMGTPAYPSQEWLNSLIVSNEPQQYVSTELGKGVKDAVEQGGEAYCTDVSFNWMPSYGMPTGCDNGMKNMYPPQWYLAPYGGQFAMYPNPVYVPMIPRAMQHKGKDGNASRGQSGSDSDSGHATHVFPFMGLPAYGASSSSSTSSSARKRLASVERYRKKKAKRTFDKRIRYATRKVNADNRPRVKGRFIKVPEEISTASTPT